jgi:DNA-binding NarL/FixJ family response regulator
MDTTESFSLTEHFQNKIRIVIGDGYPLMRLGLRTIIEKQQDLEVVAEASDVPELLATVASLHPDIIIMDQLLPGFGIDTTSPIKQIFETSPSSKVLILSDFGNIEQLRTIMKEGASDYIKKNAAGDEIIYFIRSIKLGFNPYLTKKIYKDNLRVTLGETEKIVLVNSNEITVKELDMLRAIYNGKSNKEISAITGNNISLTKAKLSTLFTKLGVSSRTEAISVCLRSGILTLKDLADQII